MKKFLVFLALTVAAMLASAQQLQPRVTLLASTVMTGTFTSADITSASSTLYKGAHVIVNVTSYSGGTYTLHVQGKDPVSGAYYDILVGTPIRAAGINVFKVYPGIIAMAGGAAADFIPSVWRVQLVGASNPLMTLSIAANLEL